MFNKKIVKPIVKQHLTHELLDITAKTLLFTLYNDKTFIITHLKDNSIYAHGVFSKDNITIYIHENYNPSDKLLEYFNDEIIKSIKLTMETLKNRKNQTEFDISTLYEMFTDIFID